MTTNPKSNENKSYRFKDEDIEVIKTFGNFYEIEMKQTKAKNPKRWLRLKMNCREITQEQFDMICGSAYPAKIEVIIRVPKKDAKFQEIVTQ